MKLPGGGRIARTDIDMVPMINFAFLLLVFFLLVGRLAPAERVAVTPPRSAQGAAGEVGTDVLIVALDGRMVFAGQPMDRERLPAQIAAWRAARAGAVLWVKADAQLHAAEVVRLLHVLRDAGVDEVRLITLRARGST